MGLLDSLFEPESIKGRSFSALDALFEPEADAGISFPSLELLFEPEIDATRPADERGAPASVDRDLTGMTLPAHGPVDWDKFTQPDSQLARTAPQGPLAASSTAVRPSIPPRGDTLSEGPGIDYRDKIGASPEDPWAQDWVKREAEEPTSIGANVRNITRDVLGVAEAIKAQLQHVAALQNPATRVGGLKELGMDVVGIVEFGVQSIYDAGTAIGTNPFAGGLNPIVEHAKVWLNQDLAAEDTKRQHEAIDRKYPDYAAARDQVDKHLFGTFLGIFGVVAPFKGAMVPKPIDVIRQARAGERGAKPEPLVSTIGEAEPKAPAARSADVSRETLPAPSPAPGIAAPRPAKQPWEMTLQEIESAIQRGKLEDQGSEIAIFGVEGAKRYEFLQRQANSGDWRKSRAASVEIDKMEAALSPEQTQRLFGVGEDIIPLETLRSYREALESVDLGGTAADLGRSIGVRLSRLGNSDLSNPGLMSLKEQIDNATIKHSLREAARLGMNVSEIYRSALETALRRFPDRADAEFMLGRFMPKTQAGEMSPIGAGASAAPSAAESILRPSVENARPEIAEIVTPVQEAGGTSGIGEPGMAGSRPLPMKMVPPTARKPVTAADIAETIQKDFGIPIRVGHFRNRALGIFKPRAEVVRTGEANALSTISHELGHFLDKKIMGGFARENRTAFSQRFSKWNDELVSMGKALYGTRKPTAGYRAEGFAEYVREWLTTGDAANRAPQFNSYFEGEFLKNNPDIAAKLARVRDLTTNYREQGAIARHRGRIDYGGDFERTTFGEKVSQALRSARTMFTDDLFPLQRAQEKLLAAGGKPKTWFYDTKRPDLSPVEVARTLAKTAHSTAALFIRKGTFDFALNKTGPGLVEILKPFSPAETIEALDYAIARRLVDAAKRGKKIPEEWRTDAEHVIKNQSRPVDPAKPSYEDATKALTAFSDRVLDYVTDAGGLSPDAVAKFRESNVIYISLRRAFKESESIKGGGSGGARLANRGTAGSLKMLKGSGRPIADPIQTYVKTIEELVGMADKTRVARLLVELAEGTEGHGVLMDRVPPPLKANTFRLDQIKKALTEAGLDLEGADLDAAMTLWSNNPVYFGKDPIVSFVRSGKREFWEVFDKDLYRSLLSMDRYQLPKFLEWTLGKPTKLVRLGATGIRAGFALITNPLRDAQTFALQTQLSPSGAARALKAVVSDPEMRPMFSRSGVSMAQPLGLDRTAMDMAVSEVLNGKRTLGEVVGHPIEALREALSITESGPRLMEFSGVYQQYPKGSAAARVAATNAASDVTVNFRRMGTMGAVINQIIPFFNPAIQGTAKMYRLVRTNPKKAGLIAVVNLTVPSLALWWQNKDEPWYKSLPDWQKYGFWNFKVGEKIVKIPRPFEWGYFFAALPEAAADAAYRKDPSHFKEFGIQLAKSMNPVDLPAAVGPLLEVAANYDSFKGHSIVPFFMERNNFAEEEYFPWTPELVKKAGSLLGMSPLKIEHILSGYTGGLAKDVLYASDDIMNMAMGNSKDSVQAADWPVVGRVFGRNFNFEAEIEQAERQLELMRLRYQNKIEHLRLAGKNDEADQVVAEALASIETERTRAQRRLYRGR